MASCGLDRVTGLPITDLAHVAQHVETLYATRLGQMIMLGHYAGGLPEILGKRITPRNIALYRLLLALPIATWEPRLSVVAIQAQGNTAGAVVLGEMRFQVLAHYRPRGHLGDLAVEGGVRGFRLGATANRLTFALDTLA
ncbi:hypothetical protein [uncultured Methylobacterium sp.]|jgi:phage baseplate assembly protein W|uniref:hypothetical protein n=1 Tax=uncultured Methylobacterium sp. TaxID=157278 RepID=UPI0026093093|nr:hypothetical protein [uncultured Methylobacterium sp.]